MLHVLTPQNNRLFKNRLNEDRFEIRVTGEGGLRAHLGCCDKDNRKPCSCGLASDVAFLAIQSDVSQASTTNFCLPSESSAGYPRTCQLGAESGKHLLNSIELSRLVFG